MKGYRFHIKLLIIGMWLVEEALLWAPIVMLCGALFLIAHVFFGGSP